MNYQTIAEQSKRILSGLGSPAFLAGGAARYLYMKGDAPEPSDLDLFFYEDRPSELLDHHLTFLGYRKGSVQGNALAWTPPEDWPAVQVVQPIKTDYSRTFGRPTEVMNNFGFTTEMFATSVDVHSNLWSRPGHPDAVQHTIDRRLVLNHITCPIGLSQRIAKYSRKGYTVDMQTIFQLFTEWEQRPLEWKARLFEAEAAGNAAEFYRLTTLD